jgi:tetraacyldisaccharide 4'-kinase
MPIRGVLRVAESAFAGVIAVRNRKYDGGSAAVRLSVPVISVGNITVGGTGKTPLVLDLLGRLDRMGRCPAVVARGYGAACDEPNDEERLIRSRFPGVAYVADADRVAGGRVAQERFGADVIVLDDGFQHRRLHRDLDVVAIDATNPFGFGHLLPRGLLREPVSSLRRADLVIVSRCNQVSTQGLEEVVGRVRSANVDAPVIKCRHDVTAIETLGGSPWAAPPAIDVRAAGGGLAGARVIALASVGNPGAFTHTLRALGAEVVDEWVFPDHYRYRASDLARLLASETVPPHDVVATTEKDAVKLRAISGVDHGIVVVVKIAIAYLDNGADVLQRHLDQLVTVGGRNEAAHPTKRAHAVP